MPRDVPTFDLYGEIHADWPELQVHCETIASRSSAYRWEIGLHRHERFLQFLYIWAGSGDAILDGVTIPVVPPCVIFVPPGLVHGFRFAPDIAGLVISAAAEQSRAGMIGQQARMLSLDAADADDSYMAQTFHRIADEYDGTRPGRSALLDTYLALVSGLVRRQGSGDAEPTAADPAQRHVAALRELVGRHFREQLTAADYAARLGLSPTHLNRVVRKVTGMTAHDLIARRSIDEAKRALVLTNVSIRQIADHLGYSDAGYFSRCFRERIGQSPREYRRTQQFGLAVKVPGLDSSR